MSEIYLVGRSAFSDNAKLYARHLGKAIHAYLMLSSTSYICTQNVVERTGYKQLLRFYQWMTRASQEKIDKIIKDNPLGFLFFPEMDFDEFQKCLLDYSTSAIKSAIKKFDKAKKESVIAEDFLDECRRAYLKKIEDEVDKDSDWYASLPVLDVQSSTACPHHPDAPYCYMMKLIRESDPIRDPMFDETLENLRAWEQSINEELLSG